MKKIKSLIPELEKKDNLGGKDSNLQFNKIKRLDGQFNRMFKNYNY